MTNLVELLPGIDHEKICTAIEQAFFNYYDETVSAEVISPQALPDLPGFTEQFAKQSSWEWNFGQAPAFSHLVDTRFVWGGIELHFDVLHGAIDRCQIFTDSLNPAPLEALAERLQGVPYRTDAITTTCQQISDEFPESQAELLQVRHWLTEVLR